MRDDFVGSPPIAFRSVFLDLAATQPDVEAILAPGREPLRFADLPERIDAVRQALNEAGIGRGDLVAVILPKGPEMAVCSIGILNCAIAVPLSADLTESEFSRYFAQIEPKAIVLPIAGLSAARNAATALNVKIIELTADLARPAGVFDLRCAMRGDPDLPGWATSTDNVLVIPTSGTTGKPKLVPHRQHHLLAYAEDTHRVLGLGPADRCIHITPMCYGHGFMSSMLAPLLLGSGVVSPDKFDVPSFFRWIETFRPTWYTAGHTVQRSILEQIDPYRSIARGAGLRFIRSASGSLDPSTIFGLEDAFQAPVIERYGMSETGTLASNRPIEGQRRAGTVGKRGMNEIRIVDEQGVDLGANREGEIVARGPSVFEGYWKDPDSDSDAFIDGWFRTGDLGVIDEDGFLTITGRLKEQINRGGEKIAPAEVESVLAQHPAVAAVCVFPVPHPSLGEDSAAAVVRKARNGAVEEELLAFARERLAPFKVPRKIVFVDELPKTANGRLRRTAMAQILGFGAANAPRRAGPNWPTRPTTPIEAALADLWKSVLGLAKLGIDEDFFLLGGDSLRAMRLQGQVQIVFGVDIRVAEVFTHASTVAGMARCIEALRRSQNADEGTKGHNAGIEAIPRRDASLPCPISYQQQWLWFIDRLRPGNPVYHMSAATRMTGPLDIPALGRAINAVVGRHEALRTNFVVSHGEPYQVVTPRLEISVPVHDLRDLPADRHAAEIQRLHQEELRKPFDLERGPLLRAALVKLAEDEHMLLIVQHHIVTDGWSRRIFNHELAALYDAFVGGKPPQLPDLPIQYPDYAAWQRRTLHGEPLQRRLDYWRNRLANVPSELHLPTDRPRPVQHGFAGARLDRIAAKPLVERFAAIAQGERTTLYFALLAALNVLLNRYSHQDDILVGAPATGRDRHETQGIVGFFLDMLAVRTDLSGEPSFRDLLRRVREAAAGDLAHQGVPLDKLMSEVVPSRRSDSSPIYRVSCVLLEHGDFLVTRPGWRQDLDDFDSGTAPFDLSFIAIETDEGMRFTFRYDAVLFEAATIERMMTHFVRLLEAIVTDPDTRISELALLSERERSTILAEWGRGASTGSDGRSLHRLFEDTAARLPGEIAVQGEDGQLTYDALNRRANQIAHYLRSLHVGPDIKVAICMKRSIDLVVAVLGVLKAGGAYVPLDPDYPAQRLAYMVADAAAPIVLTQGDATESLAEVGATIVRIDRHREEIARCPDRNAPVAVAPGDLAYVLYTSGSTGTPKGVMISHRAICNHMAWMQIEFPLTPADRVLQSTSFSFDASVWEFFAPLAAGARLVLARPDRGRDSDYLIDAVEAHGITVFQVVPTLLQSLLVGGRLARCGTLQRLFCGGEALSGDLADAFARQTRAELVNLYGPTECCIDATFHRVSRGTERMSVPIGRPIDNMRVYLLDDRREPVPAGSVGELYIGGPGVARGYLNLPELTADRFVANPFGDAPGARLYRTGDLARFLSDGSIEFIGRADDQIKIRGHRIDPGEVEAALRQYPAIALCAVAAKPSADGAAALVAYLAGDPELLDVENIRRHLRKLLPEHLLPAAIVVLPTLPVTSSGKIDRKALPSPEWERFAPAAAYVAPRTPIEERLAAIWIELLGRDRVGIHDNFFDLGGHSLLATKLVFRISDSFDCALRLERVFASPTIEALAVEIVMLLSESTVAHAADGAQAKTHDGRDGQGAVAR